MELLQELFVSGFLAVIFSLLVAKLVSFAMSTDDHSTTGSLSTKNAPDFSVEPLAEGLFSREKLEVQGATIEDVTAPVHESHERRVEELAEPDNFIIKEEVKKQEEEEEEEEEEETEAEAEDAVIEGERKVEIEDDWEGIERSELEKAFLEAARVVGSGEGGEGGLKLELYGLHKIATEGPCREQRPLALKLSARAKWNAWQRLGNMSPEVAMEQYVALVSDKVPGWMEDKITREAGLRSSEAADSSFLATDSSTDPSSESKVADNRNPELEHRANKTDIFTDNTSEENRVKEREG